MSTLKALKKICEDDDVVAYEKMKKNNDEEDKNDDTKITKITYAILYKIICTNDSINMYKKLEKHKLYDTLITEDLVELCIDNRSTTVFKYIIRKHVECKYIEHQSMLMCIQVDCLDMYKIIPLNKYKPSVYEICLLCCELNAIKILDYILNINMISIKVYRQYEGDDYENMSEFHNNTSDVIDIHQNHDSLLSFAYNIENINIVKILLKYDDKPTPLSNLIKQNIIKT